MTTKHSLRHRWPLYAILLLFCITSVAILVLVMHSLQEPASGASIPSAIVD